MIIANIHNHMRLKALITCEMSLYTRLYCNSLNCWDRTTLFMRLIRFGSCSCFITSDKVFPTTNLYICAPSLYPECDFCGMKINISATLHVLIYECTSLHNTGQIRLVSIMWLDYQVWPQYPVCGYNVISMALWVLASVEIVKYHLN